jgi:hypothetical protein
MHTHTHTKNTLRFLLYDGTDKHKHAAFTNTDGVLGLAYSSATGSASLLRTLSQSARTSWGVQQPSEFRRLRPLVFAVFANQKAGELHLGGFDPAAASARECVLFNLLGV